MTVKGISLSIENSADLLLGALKILTKMTCELITNSMDDWLQTKFVVTCADLSGGRLHNPDERFQVVVPDCVLDNGENAPISVELCIQRFP